MFDRQMDLMSRHLARIAGELESDPQNVAAWQTARETLGEARASEPDLAAAIDAKDCAALRGIVTGWASGARLLPEEDREVLKRAMKAFRKSLKVTRLDAESSIAGGPMSSGRHSGIVGVTPPARYPREVWDELVRQGRLRGGKMGIYELPPE
jgi:hypothetical protein